MFRCKNLKERKERIRFTFKLKKLYLIFVWMRKNMDKICFYLAEEKIQGKKRKQKLTFRNKFYPSHFFYGSNINFLLSPHFSSSLPNKG